MSNKRRPYETTDLRFYYGIDEAGNAVIELMPRNIVLNSKVVSLQVGPFDLVEMQSQMDALLERVRTLERELGEIRGKADMKAYAEEFPWA